MKRNSNFFSIMAALIVFGGAIFGLILGFVCKIDTSGIFAKLKFNVGLMFQTWII